MKRFSAMLVCLILMINMMAIPGFATEVPNTIIISQTITRISDDSYYIETISVPTTQLYDNTKIGTKTAAFVVSGTTIFSISVTGTFSYDGTSSEATSASGSITAYVDGVTLKSRSAYTSGASAIATGSVTYVGITLQKTVTLTCDKNGNLS